MRILKFSAIWCQPCSELAKRIESLRASWDGFKKVSFTEFDIDDEKTDELVSKYEIKNIPTLVMLPDDNDDEVLLKLIGVVSEEQLKMSIEKAQESEKEKREV